MAHRYADYLGDDGPRVDLADLIANSVYDDPEPTIYGELDAAPEDAPPPPPAGPTVQVQGPDHDGRWVALWFHRGELRQFWGTRHEVTAWAVSQPADRRRISVDGAAWRPLTP